MTKGRWHDYVMLHGTDFRPFWQQLCRTGSRRLLFVMGHGFDPRMCEAIRTIVMVRGDAHYDCLVLKYEIGPIFLSEENSRRTKKNWDELKDLVEGTGCGTLKSQEIAIWSEDGVKVASLSASRVFNSLDQLAGYTDIIVDVSAMPQGIYFPLTRKLLRLLDRGKRENPSTTLPNLHVVVAENRSIDDEVSVEGLAENATFLHGFDASDREAEEQKPKIWIPVLGEGQENELNKIRQFIRPDEICPLLPFPSSNPRRGDNLVREYQRFLFDDLNIDPGNFIYADERNPFQAYRHIRKTALQYDDAFSVLHGCKIVLSSLSSKLLAIGTFLAAYDLKLSDGRPVGVAHVEPMGYQLGRTIEEVMQDHHSELFELWLTGECYEV